jgi:hypothetical protein
VEVLEAVVVEVAVADVAVAEVVVSEQRAEKIIVITD